MKRYCSLSCKVQSALRSLMSSGCSTLMITHNKRMAMQADVVYVMSSGRIVESGHPKALNNDRASVFARSF